MAQPAGDTAKISAKQKEIFALQQKLQEKSLSYQQDGGKTLTVQQLFMLSPGCGLGFATGAGHGLGLWSWVRWRLW